MRIWLKYIGRGLRLLTLRPRLAFVLGAEHAALAVLDDGVDDVRSCAR